MKLFQNLASSFREDDFLKICSCSYSESSPIHQSHFCILIKIWMTTFEKGHIKNNSVNWGLEATDSVVLID